MPLFGFNRDNAGGLLRLLRGDRGQSKGRGSSPLGRPLLGIPQFAVAPPEAVQVWATSGSPQEGDLLAADGDGYFPARIRRRVEGVMTTIGDPVKLRFLDFHDSDAGQYFAFHGKYYPAFLVEGGEGTPVTDTVYISFTPDTTFLAKRSSGLAKGSSAAFDLYHRQSSEADSGFDSPSSTKALGVAYTANKWATVQRIGKFWYVGCYES